MTWLAKEELVSIANLRKTVSPSSIHFSSEFILGKSNFLFCFIKLSGTNEN